MGTACACAGERAHGPQQSKLSCSHAKPQQHMPGAVMFTASSCETQQLHRSPGADMSILASCICGSHNVEQSMRANSGLNAGGTAHAVDGWGPG